MIAIRRATAPDADAVADVYLASFHATYAFPLAYSDAQVREWLRDVVAGQEVVVLRCQKDRQIAFHVRTQTLKRTERIKKTTGDNKNTFVRPAHVSVGMRGKVRERSGASTPRKPRVHGRNDDAKVAGSRRYLRLRATQAP